MGLIYEVKLPGSNWQEHQLTNYERLMAIAQILIGQYHILVRSGKQIFYRKTIEGRH